MIHFFKPLSERVHLRINSLFNIADRYNKHSRQDRALPRGCFIDHLLARPSCGAVGDGVTPVRAAGGAADGAEAECIHPAWDEILCEDAAGIGVGRDGDP